MGLYKYFKLNWKINKYTNITFSFQLKCQPIAKTRFRKYFICFAILTKTNAHQRKTLEKQAFRKKLFFSRVFRQFLIEFSIFLKTAFSAEIPINRDRIVCNAYNNMPNVECIKLMAIIEANMGQNGRSQINFLLNYLRYQN